MSLSPFPLDQIPSELIRRIVKKLKPLEYGRLLRSCCSMRDVCNDCQNIVVSAKQASIHALPDKMIISIPPFILECDPEKNDFRPFGFIVDELEIGVYVVPISVKKLTDLIQQIKISCTSLTICGTLLYTTDEMKELLELAQPKALALLRHPVTKQFSPFEIINKMAAIQLQNSDYGDEEVLALTAENIEINCCGMTNWGINQMLKQWLRGERTISSVILYGELTYSVEEIVEDLPASLLYDAAHHQFSLLKGLKQPPDKIKDVSFYVLIKSDDISKKLLLIIRKDEIQYCKCQHPVETFLVNLTKSD